jgi:modulator of FtsH protease HflK
MAWNEPGGDKDPWKNSGRGNKPPDGPPDLEELLRSAKDSILGLFGLKKRQRPAPAGGGRADGPSNPFTGILPIVLIFLALWAVIDSYHVISARERGVVLRFGKFDRMIEPGLRFTLPRPFESVTRVDVTQVRSSGGKVRMLTRDENLIDIDFAVQYTVNNAKDFAFNVREPDLTLGQVSEAAVRQVVGTTTLDDVLIGSRAQISEGAREILQESLNRYQTGINVTAVNLQDVIVPAEVKEAFDDAIRAREKEQQLINEARADAERLVPTAEGQAARLLQSAEGYRDVLIERAKGDASRFQQLVVQYRQAPEIMRRRLYLETIEEIMAKTPKVLIDQGNGNNMMYLPLDRMVNGANNSSGNNNPARQAPAMSSGGNR